MAIFPKAIHAKKSPVWEIATVGIPTIYRTDDCVNWRSVSDSALIEADSASPSCIHGTRVPDWSHEGFVLTSVSTTVSKLTFGTIQSLAAESIGMSKSSLRAL